jgi:hypothetical protein
MQYFSLGNLLFPQLLIRPFVKARCRPAHQSFQWVALHLNNSATLPRILRMRRIIAVPHHDFHGEVVNLEVPVSCEAPLLSDYAPWLMIFHAAIACNVPLSYACQIRIDSLRHASFELSILKPSSREQVPQH